QGHPIFPKFYGASQLNIPFPSTVAEWLRLTVDDRRSLPVPFTGASIQTAAGDAATVDVVPVRISERDENPGETRLALNLGAANLDVAAIQVDTPESLFMR